MATDNTFKFKIHQQTAICRMYPGPAGKLTALPKMLQLNL